MTMRAGRLKRFAVGVAVGATALAVLPLAGVAAADTPAAPPSSAAFCANATSTNPFTDVTSGNVHFDDILCLYSSGITQGTTPSTYAPADVTRRDQMASFIARMVDEAVSLESTSGSLTALPAAGSSPFTDVASSNVHAGDISRLAQAGIVKGTTASTFDPSAPVTRDQMASFINRAYEYVTGLSFSQPGSDDFTDIAGNVHAADINALAGQGIVQGTGGGVYAPRQDVRRDQMASFVIRLLAEMNDAGLINALPVSSSGQVTLATTTTAAGGTISGTVSDPTTVQTLSVSGCGLANTNLPISAAGGFTVSVPASQAAGPCTLTFVVQRTDGTSATVTEDVTVTARASATTAAPDLVSASLTTGTPYSVTYVFDQTISSVPPNGAGFTVNSVADILLSGPFTATHAQIQPDGKTVVVTFPSTTPMPLLTVANVAKNVVQTPAGVQNYATSAPLAGITFPKGYTTGPDLVSVGNEHTLAGGNRVYEFTFDKPVDNGSAGPAPVAADFHLVAADGHVYNGHALDSSVNPGPFHGVSANGEVVSVVFDTALNAVPVSQVERGYVDLAAVSTKVTATSPTPTPNVAESVTLNTGVTNQADLTGAVVSGSNQVTFTFDEPINANAGQLHANKFEVVLPIGIGLPGSSAVRSSSDPHQVTVTFTSPLPSLSIVGYSTLVQVLPGAVHDTQGITGPNRFASAGLQAVSTTAGRTAITPDLVSVTRQENALGVYKITFTFDKHGPAIAAAVPGMTYYLVDAAGQQFHVNPARVQVIDTPAGTEAIVYGGDATTWDSTLGSYSNGVTTSQAAAAVLGAVDGSPIGAPNGSQPISGN